METFKFGFKPPASDAGYVHIWHAFNPAIGVDYGYGGIKLFNKDFFTDVKSQLDFSTTLTKDVKIIDEIACLTRFNSDQIRSFRGAFRESVKLYINSIDKNRPKNEQREAKERLASWMEPLPKCDYREFVVAGAMAGIAEVKQRIKEKNTLYINDHDLIRQRFLECYPELDFRSDPWELTEENPMKHELFFTTRIASSFYDPYVLEHVKIEELRDALSDGQLLSKNWLVEIMSNLNLENKLSFTGESKPRVAILGGWIGTLSLIMHSWDLPFKVTSIDIDERSNRIAEKLNYDYDFSTMTMDMYDIDYDQFDIIINTASEHIPDIQKWRSKIPNGKIIVVQNNDFTEGNGHVSCVKNSNELKKLLLTKEILYEGTRQFPQYSRFMLIGRT